MTEMYEPQFFTAPDGTVMAIVTRARLDALLDLEEELDDIDAVNEGRASIAAEGGIPLEVDRAIAGGQHPLVAWRKFRHLTQKELAEAAEITQAAVARLEGAEPGAGKPETLDALAKALDAPRWTLGGHRERIANAVFLNTMMDHVRQGNWDSAKMVALQLQADPHLDNHQHFVTEAVIRRLGEAPAEPGSTAETKLDEAMNKLVAATAVHFMQASAYRKDSGDRAIGEFVQALMTALGKEYLVLPEGMNITPGARHKERV